MRFYFGLYKFLSFMIENLQNVIIGDYTVYILYSAH